MTWPIGLARRPARTRSRYSASVSTMPPPVPPSVKAGRTMAGRPIVASASSAAPSRAAWRRALDDHRSARTAGRSGRAGRGTLPVLGHLDGLERRAQEPDAVPLEDAGVGQRDGQVERGLAAQAGQEAVRPLRCEDRSTASTVSGSR